MTPPAVSVNTPSVLASRRMPSRISCSVHHSMCPPVCRATVSANIPSAGAPIASDRAIVSGLTGADFVDTVEERLRHRTAALGLRARDPVRLLLDGADRDELAERPVDLGEQRAARDRHHDVVGQAPSELLGGLEPERLRALRVVRAHVHVDERPRQRLGHLAAQAVHRVVVALDRHDLRTVGLGREDLRALEVLGHEHVALEAGLRGVRRGRVRQVAGRGAARSPRSRTHVPSCVATLTTRSLNGSMGSPSRPSPRSRRRGRSPSARLSARRSGVNPAPEVDPLDAGAAGQQRLVPPERLWTGLRLLAELDAVDRLEIVGGLERPEALLADRERLDRVLLAADPALERRRAM